MKALKRIKKSIRKELGKRTESAVDWERVNDVLSASSNSLARNLQARSDDGLFVKNGLQMIIQELKDATPETERIVVEAQFVYRSSAHPLAHCF